MFNTLSPPAISDTKGAAQQALTFRPSSLGRFKAEVASIQQQRNQGELAEAAALSQLSQTIRLAAEFAEEVGDASQAHRYWQQATQLIPQDASAWHGLGVAKANLHDYPGAAQALQQCLQLDPSNLKAKLTLAELQQLVSPQP